MADGPENKNVLEQLNVRQKSERIRRGDPEVGSLWNRPIRVKIYMTDCWLYSYPFAYASSSQIDAS